MYLLSRGVLMWDVPYLWGMYVVPASWDSLPPYTFGEWRLELAYGIMAAWLMAMLVLGPVLVVALVGVPGWELRRDARRVEGFCWERHELEERAREGKKGG